MGTRLGNLPLFFLFCGSISFAAVLPRENVTLFSRQSIAASSAFDHSWIESFTSLGDSYSVGLGAGHAISAAPGLQLNTDCYQYSYGYPNILNMNGMIGVNPNRNFQYLGCSGAVVPDVTSKQVPKMQNSQLVTISAGGNDAHLSTILNYCVFQWSTWWPWTCDGEITSANNTINSAGYTNDMKALASAVGAKLIDKNSRIYWVGYERFFDETTNECDSVTWSFTRTIGFRQYLTQDRRRKMNSLADNVNSKIKAVCDATPQCVFIDPAADINRMTGHFCEPGVDESYHWPNGGVSANRERTWFYEWGTNKDDDSGDDATDNQPQKRGDLVRRTDYPLPLDGSFEAGVAFYVKRGQQLQEIDPTIANTFPDITAQGSVLPDSYGRIFHHDKFANGVVAMNVLKAMDVEQGKMMGEPPTTTTAKECAVAAATPTCDVSSDQLNGPYCVCSSGSSTVTASAIATPAPGHDQCYYTAFPSGSQIETIKQTPTTTTAAPQKTAPYSPTGSTGPNQINKCHIHVWEYWNCNDDDSNLSASIQLWDAAGNQMFGPTPPQDSPRGINAGAPGEWTSKLENKLEVTGEHQNDYVQYTLGGTSWTSSDNDQTANAYCNTGGWDPKGGPECGGSPFDDTTQSIRQMDCYFPCPWNGGPSSDGS